MNEGKDTRTLEMLERVRIYFKARTNEPVVPVQRMTRQEWDDKFEAAVQDYCTTLRTGKAINWDEHRFIQRKTSVIRHAESIIRSEDESALCEINQFVKTSRNPCQLWMLLFILIGLLSGKPLVGIRDDTKVQIRNSGKD